MHPPDKFPSWGAKAAGGLLLLFVLLLSLGRPHHDVEKLIAQNGVVSADTFYGLPLGDGNDDGWVSQHLHADFPLPDPTTQLSPVKFYPPPNPRLYRVVSTKPPIYFFPRIVTDDEADYIINAAKSQMRRSLVAASKVSRDSVSTVRTSQGAWLDLTQRGPLGGLYNRVMNLTQGMGWHEQLQVLRYTKGQHYLAHNDFFDPAYYGHQTWNRVITFLFYLSTVPAGGESVFPRAGGRPTPRNWSDCSAGLRYRPKKGSGVMFFNMRPDMLLEPYSLHGGCDVLEGEKWAAPLWIKIKIPDGKGVLASQR